MAASYPASIKSFTVHSNTTETIDASHVNALQDEVAALENAVGTTPATSTTPSSSGTFNATSYAYTNISARLANIETGIVADSHTQYLKKTGDTITPSGAGVKGLVIRATSGQTANLIEFQNSSGTTVTSVDSTGTLQGLSITGTIRIGSTSITLNGAAVTTLTGVSLASPTISGGQISSTSLSLATNSISNTTTYSFVSTDVYSLVTVSNATAVTVTVPLNLISGTGQQLNIVQYGAGQITLVGATGVTLFSTGANTAQPKTRAQYSVITLFQVSANTWLATGDIS